MPAVARRTKPVYPVINAAHPLAFGLTHFWTMHEGQGLVLRNCGSYGPANDFLIDNATEQSWVKDDTTGVGMVISANAASNSNRGQPRSALPDFGGLWSCQMRISTRACTDTWCRIIGNGTGSGMWVKGSGAGGTAGKFSMETNLGNTTSNATMDITSTNRTWYDWIVTHNQSGSVTAIYLNGVLDVSFSAGGFGVWQPNSMFNDSGSETLVALVEFIRIWKGRALTAGEAYQAAADPYAVLRPTRRFYLFGAPSAIIVAPTNNAFKLASAGPSAIFLGYPSVIYGPAARALKFASVAPTVRINTFLTPPFARYALAATGAAVSMGSAALTPPRAVLKLSAVAPTVKVGAVVQPAARSFKLAALAPEVVYGSSTFKPQAAVFRFQAKAPSLSEVFPLNFGTSADWDRTYQSVTWPVEQTLTVLNVMNEYGDGFDRGVNFNLAFTRADGVGSVTNYPGRNMFKLRLITMQFDKAAKVLWQFYKRVGGSLNSFYLYNVPDERMGADPTGLDPVGRYRVRFMDNSLTREKFALQLYRAEITLIEVRD